MPARDDFPERTKRALAARVAHICSNPSCRAPTSGPQSDPAKVVNVGVGAHITAASSGGPRYATALSEVERSGPDNGIWLCQNCAKLIDSDLAAYPTEVLRRWKTDAEQTALKQLGKSVNTATQVTDYSIRQILACSGPNDWMYYDPEATFTFRPNVNLRIVQKANDDLSQFPESWASKFPDPTAHLIRFTVYYGASPITDLWAVSVDGGRCYIPLPHSATNLTITDAQYAFGRIIHLSNSRYDFDSYFDRTGIAVVPG